jgi:GntR family transcriptional regulator
MSYGPRRGAADRQPKYLRIHADLRERIMSRQWPPGTLLPAQRELADEFGVSVMTARQALQLLNDDGLIQSRQGCGTYVAAHYAYDLGDLRSFATHLAGQGAQITTRILSSERIAAPEHVAARLGDHRDVLRLRRLRLVAGRPVMVQTSYLPVPLVGDLSPDDLAQRGLYALLDERGLTITRAAETITLANLRPHNARDLGRPRGSNALLSRRLSFTSAGTPVVDDYALLPGDTVAITVNRSPGQVTVRYELTVHDEGT